MELRVNGQETDITTFQADELAQAVLISLFHGANLKKMTASRHLIGRAGGETPMRLSQAIASARGYGFFSEKRFFR